MDTRMCDRCKAVNNDMSKFKRISVRPSPTTQYSSKTLDELIDERRRYEQIANMANSYSIKRESIREVDLCESCYEFFNKFLDTPPGGAK